MSQQAKGSYDAYYNYNNKQKIDTNDDQDIYKLISAVSKKYEKKTSDNLDSTQSYKNITTTQPVNQTKTPSQQTNKLSTQNVNDIDSQKLPYPSTVNANNKTVPIKVNKDDEKTTLQTQTSTQVDEITEQKKKVITNPINSDTSVEKKTKNLETNTCESDQVTDIIEYANNDLYSYDETVLKLNCLAGAKKYHKISVYGGSLSNSNTVLSWVPVVGEGTVRFLYGEGREQTHLVIEKIIRSAEYHSKVLISKISTNDEKIKDYESDLARLTDGLSKSQVGIRNLAITYWDDDEFLAKLYSREEKLYERFFKNMYRKNLINEQDNQRNREELLSYIEKNKENNELFSYDETVLKLICLAGAKKNHKLTIHNGSLTNSTSAFSWVPIVGEGTVRFLYGEGREQTHSVIEKVIKSAEYHSKLLISKILLNDEKNGDYGTELAHLTDGLSKAQMGIKNLSITYRDDDEHLAKLYSCGDKLYERFFKNMEKQI